MMITGVAVMIGAALLALVSPLIALWAGLVRVLTETRETAVRPRPFIGRIHGFPFLDPPALPSRSTGHDGDD